MNGANPKQISSSSAEKNLRVSQCSRFSDDIWDFRHEMPIPSLTAGSKCVVWNFKIRGNQSFTAANYHSMLLAFRQLIYALLKNTPEGRGLKPASALRHYTCLKRFVSYLLTRPGPILTFDQVTPALIERYIKELRKVTKPNSTFYCHLSALRLLFLYRRQMSNSLRFDPFALTSPATQAGYNRNYRDQHLTDYIPDDVLHRLITAALEYVEEKAPIILRANALVAKMKEEGKANGQLDTYVALQIRIKLQTITRAMDNSSASPKLNFSTLNKLSSEKTRLRTACGILIAFATGIRLSELLSIKVGSIKTVRNSDGEFIWLQATLYKTQGRAAGTASKWLAGPIAQKAVSVLERLTKSTREQTHCPYLFIPVTRNGLKNWDRQTPSPEVFDAPYLREFTEFTGVKDEHGLPFHVHPHMFRRTFARHIVRCDTTNLMALKEHFKHWSVAMTDRYVGIDEELQVLLDNENDLLSFDSFDRVLRSNRLAGRRGKELVNMIDSAIVSGRLPATFRGEAGQHMRKTFAQEFIEAGQQIYPCGASNFCWFREDIADCTEGNKPIVEFCNPPGCANSIIEGEQHRAYWENVAAEGENLLAMKPKGGPYEARLVKITRIAKKIVSDLG